MEESVVNIDESLSVVVEQLESVVFWQQVNAALLTIFIGLVFGALLITFIRGFFI